MQTGIAAAQSTVTRPIALLSAAAFCVSSCLRITDPMLPLLAHDFRVSTGAASVVVSAFTFAYSLSQLAFGPIGDRFGKYRVLCIAMALSACTIAAGSTAQSLRELAALRLLAGITTAGVLSLALAYVGDVVAYEHRQAVLARVLSGQLLGVITGQAAGGILIAFVSWRVVFLVLGGIFACVAILLCRELRSGRVMQSHRSTPPPPGRFAAQYVALLMGRRSRIVLLAIFCEGLMFFGLLAYFAAYLRFRFALDYVAIGAIARLLRYRRPRLRLVRAADRPGAGRARHDADRRHPVAAWSAAAELDARMGRRCAGDGDARLRFVHGAQHTANQRHATRTRGAGRGRFAVQFVLLLRPGDRSRSDRVRRGSGLDTGRCS